MFDELLRWPPHRWMVAFGASVVIALVVGLPTDVIPNPVFGRPVAVTWWSYPVLLSTAVLGGVLAATYVRVGDAVTDPPGQSGQDDGPARAGGIGGVMSFFAVGCPVCNKLVVVALGTVGARRWFEPFQPLLAAVSVVLLLVALRSRLRNAGACALRVPAGSRPS